MNRMFLNEFVIDIFFKLCNMILKVSPTYKWKL